MSYGIWDWYSVTGQNQLCSFQPCSFTDMTIQNVQLFVRYSITVFIIKIWSIILIGVTLVIVTTRASVLVQYSAEWSRALTAWTRKIREYFPAVPLVLKNRWHKRGLLCCWFCIFRRRANRAPLQKPHNGWPKIRFWGTIWPDRRWPWWGLQRSVSL